MTRNARLVMRRELRARLSTRAFRVSLIAMALLAAGGSLAASLLGGGRTTYDIGVVGTRSAAIAAALPQQVAGTDERVHVHRLADAGAAERAVRREQLDAAVIDGSRILVKSDAESGAARVARGAARVAATVTTLQDAGVAPAAIGRALDPPPPDLRTLDPAAKHRDTDRAIVWAGLILLYLLLISLGNMVLASVVEEKASRIVEVLLVTVRPREILAGKLVALGLLGLINVLTVGGAAIAARLAAGKGGIPAAGTEVFVLTAAWFVLGYALYAAGYAVLGALVSRQEDTASAQGPMTVVLVAAYIAAVTSIGSPDAPLAQVCSYIPFTAPMSVPARVVLGDMSAVEFALSVVLTVGATVALVAFAASLYERTVLRSGAPLRLTAVLREGRGRRTHAGTTA